MKKARANLTKELIVEAAIELADQNGIDALSMRSLATRLDVKAMSLYNHIKNKQQLIDEMIESIIAKFFVSYKDMDWKEAMEERAVSMHQTLMAHQWAAEVILPSLQTGPHTLTFIDKTLGCLETAGIPLALADWAMNLMDSYIYGFTIQELTFPIDQSEYRQSAATYLPFIDKTVYPSMHGLTTLVAEGNYDGKQDFGFGLGIILDGIEKLIVT